MPATMQIEPGELETAWREATRSWDEEKKSERLFERDASLWTDRGEEQWLGWLDAAARELARVEEWSSWQRGLGGAGIEHVLLLGMGGSSLGPEVIASVLGGAPGWPRLVMLDSTDPAAIDRVRRGLDVRRTLVVAASKSGTTLETALLLDLFEEWLRAELGERAGEHLVAVTDPGSALEQRARERRFRDVHLGEPTIGGRFSVLSPFGLVPALAIGVDVGRFLEPLTAMTEACRERPAGENPGVALGLLMGIAARAGRDKLTLVADPPLGGFGAWLEQLIAESTGKGGRGIVPIDREPGHVPSWSDRVAVRLTLDGEAVPSADDGLPAGDGELPRVELRLASPWQLAAEFYRWQVATAVAGSVLGVDPFDQPDVEAAKVRARELTARVEAGGELDAERPAVEENGVAAYAGATSEGSLADLLRDHLGSAGAGDYVALLAFLEPRAETDAALQEIRKSILHGTGCATTLGFGPRYLHSTGQLHKGGPASGVYLVITDDASPAIAVPGRDLDFGQVRDAQALGDVAVLRERGRRVLRLRLVGDAGAGLAHLVDVVRSLFASDTAGG